MPKKANKIPITSKGLNINPSRLTTQEQLELRRMLAKRLNQRMRRLKAKGYTAEMGGAYADFQDLLVRFFPGRNWIPENLDNEAYKGLPRTQIRAMQSLLKEKSSTVQGWKEIISKRRNMLANTYGITFQSESEMNLFFKSQVWKWMQTLYDSKQTMRIISNKLDEKTISQIIQDLEKFRNKTDENMADKVAKELGFSSESEALKYRP